jgi:ribonuclease E
MDRKVWLPSGGTLVIDRTEAMTVVDVNTGKFTGSGGNLEETVTRNNLEAAEEIVRQLRLRDIGGIVVIDFIDMVLESNRDLVLRRLTEALARDRTRHQVSEVTSLGLVQLTRKRLGTGLVEAFSTACPHCGGRGILLHVDPIESTPAGRKETGGRRGKRSRKARGDEPAIAKVPDHVPGEHPLFKAMAAARSEEGEEELVEGLSEEDVEASAAQQVADVVAGEDLVDEDFDESDEEDEDEEDDEIDVDLDEDDEDLDDDLDIEIEDADSNDDEAEEDDSADSGDDDGVEQRAPVVSAPVRPASARRRRRSAARPAGPPSHEG